MPGVQILATNAGIVEDPAVIQNQGRNLAQRIVLGDAFTLFLRRAHHDHLDRGLLTGFESSDTHLSNKGGRRPGIQFHSDPPLLDQV